MVKNGGSWYYGLHSRLHTHQLVLSFLLVYILIPAVVILLLRVATVHTGILPGPPSISVL